MGLILMVSAIVFLSGVLQVGHVVWTKRNKATLLAKYKPGTVARKVVITNLSNRRLAVTVLGTAIAGLVAFLVCHSVATTYGDSADTVIRGSLVAAVFSTFIAIYLVYSVYKK